MLGILVLLPTAVRMAVALRNVSVCIEECQYFLERVIFPWEEVTEDGFDDADVARCVDIEVDLRSTEKSLCLNILHRVDFRMLPEEEGAIFADCGIVGALGSRAQGGDREHLRVHPGGIGRLHVITDEIVWAFLPEDFQAFLDHCGVDEWAITVDLDADGSIHLLEGAEHPTENIVLCATERRGSFSLTEGLNAIILRTLGCCHNNAVNIPYLSDTVEEVAEEWAASNLP